MNGRNLLILVFHAFIGWALCGSTMGIGMALAPQPTALIVHAIAAPIIFFFVSLSYFRRPGALGSAAAALAFVGFVKVVDFFLVALVINKSLAMFASPLGTWIPFGLIFLSTFLTGSWIASRPGGRACVPRSPA